MPARQKPSEFGLDTQLDTDTLKLLLSFVRPNASKLQKRHDDTTRNKTKLKTIVDVEKANTIGQGTLLSFVNGTI